MNNFQKALKHKADSTPNRGLRMANGGAVEGPGTGTSDGVRARLSDGEYVLPADTVQAVGVENLDMLKDSTHTNVGTRAPMAFADGGLFEDPNKAQAERLRAMTVKPSVIPPSVPPSVQLETSGDAQASRLRNMTGLRAALPPLPADVLANPGADQASRLRNMTPQPSAIPRSVPLGEMGPAAPSALPVETAPAASEQGARLRNMSPRTAGLPPSVPAGPEGLPPRSSFGPPAPATGLRGALGTASKVLGGAGTALGGALMAKESYEQSKVLPTDLDRAALAGENVARFAGATAGASAGATIGSAVPLVGNVVGGLAGGALGYFAPDAVKKATDFVGLTDASTQLPSAKANGLRAAQQPSARASAGEPAAAEPTYNRLPGNVAAFQQQYAGAAAKAAERLGVDPNMLLAQWGMETGWGKQVIPGTNNLGNIKDFSGKGTGVAATDNMTGSRDKYMKFGSAEEFADKFADLMERKYSGVKGATDIGQFSNGLLGGQNRYAEDPQYAAKLARSYGMLGGKGQGAPLALPPAQGVRGGMEAGGLRDRGAPISQATLDAEKKNGSWVEVIRGLQSTEEWVGNDGAEQMYAPGTSKTEARAQNAAFDNFAAPGRKVEVDALEADTRAKSAQLASRLADENKDADRVVKIEAQNMAKAKEGWAEFRRDSLEANTTQGPTGPLVNYEAVNRLESGMKVGLASLGAQSPADLSLENRERLKAAIDLADKVNTISSNLNPLKPDPIAGDDPTDLFGLERLPNGDAVMRNGQIIPKRVIDKVDSDFFMGKPTNKYESLFKKPGAKNGVR